MFLSILQRVEPKKLERASVTARKLLARNPDHLRDHRSEQLFENHIDH